MEGRQGEARPVRKRYWIEIRRKAAKELRRVPEPDRLRIAQDIDQLATDPRPAGRVKQLDKDIYRIRTGNYRSIYQVRDSERLVTVLVIGHRRFVYEEFDRSDR